MALLALLLIVLIRGALFTACRLLLLPLLFGEARHASLDSLEDAEDEASVPLTSLRGASLPAPVSSRTSSAGGLRSLRASIAHGAAIPGAATAPRLFGTLDVHSATALLFAVSFEEASVLFALVLLEAMGLERRTLVWNWGFSLMSTLSLAVVLIRE